MRRARTRAATRALLAATAATAATALAAAPASAQSRPDVAGTHAAVTSDHPLASAAGAAVLRRGGNAVDAAVTMAAVLAVVRPHMNGVGGDAFILYRDARTGEVHALNGSGGAGSLATPALFAGRKLDRIPMSGILSVSVPGAVRAWDDLLRRHGTIELARALEPAIGYARDGFPVSMKLSRDIEAERSKLETDPVAVATFLPGGKAPAPGTILRQPELAATLERIAREGPDALYKGELARRIAEFMQREGGLLTAEDLARHRTEWTDPISTEYRGLRILTVPPNSQGVTLLQMLNLAELFDLERMGHNSPEYIHTLVQIKKKAFADRDRHVADPAFYRAPVERLLSKEYARELARDIHPAATSPQPDGASGDGDGDTVYLTVVDAQGNAVSWIQSLFSSFGSGRMVPGTGIVLHNRAALLSLEPGHANLVAPGKRPYHTLMTGMALRPGGELAMVFGTPGGDGQPQTLLQVLNNLLLFGMLPQSAVDAPRWRGYEDGRLAVEAGIPEATRARLKALGHDVALQDGSASDFGGAQVILLPAGSRARITGADPRREAYGVAW